MHYEYIGGIKRVKCADFLFQLSRIFFPFFVSYTSSPSPQYNIFVDEYIDEGRQAATVSREKMKTMSPEIVPYMNELFTTHVYVQ
jgi:hypothetical protein